jgi:hypothetical protein
LQEIKLRKVYVNSHLPQTMIVLSSKSLGVTISLFPEKFTHALNCASYSIQQEVLIPLKTALEMRNKRKPDSSTSYFLVSPFDLSKNMCQAGV